jgi:RNA polymerase sigma factor (TIGR02999 family)
MSDVTRILSRIESGDPLAADQLLPLVYDELRKLAAARLAQEKPGQTLAATALVHDAFIRLVDSYRRQAWNSRGHFFGAAAEAMRRILVERARRRLGPRRGGNVARLALDAVAEAAESNPAEILAVHEALAELDADSPQAARLVKLRYFAGMGHQEAAECLGISRTTADRLWVYAKASLYKSLRDDARRENFPEG